MRIPGLLAATSTALLVALPARAAGMASLTGTYNVEYTGYSHGFTVLKLAGTLNFSPSGYSAHVTFHTAGMVGMMVHSDNDSHVTGHFQGLTAQPSEFDGTGHLRGTDRLTRITYAGGNPVVQALAPPVERERSPVPVAQTEHTIDTLSAVSLLIRAVAEGGTCDGGVTTFDGRRLATQTSHTAGMDDLPDTGKSIFHGKALRCDFEGRQLGGFVNNENEDDLKKPRYGAAWLAPLLPNAPPVPVQVVFENKILGKVTLVLTAVTGSDTVAKATP
jgi:hypothetical protein